MSDWFAAGETEREVPDPYYGGPAGFDAVVQLLERAMESLVQEMKQQVQD